MIDFFPPVSMKLAHPNLKSCLNKCDPTEPNKADSNNPQQPMRSTQNISHVHCTFVLQFRPCLFLFTPTSFFQSVRFLIGCVTFHATIHGLMAQERPPHTHTQRFLIVKFEWVLILMIDSGLYTQMVGPTCLRPHDDLMRHNVFLVLGQDVDKISPVIFMVYPGFSQWKTSQHRYWTPSSTI